MREFECPICIFGKVRLKKKYHKTKIGLAKHIVMEAHAGKGVGDKAHQDWIKSNTVEGSVKGVMKTLEMLSID